MGACYYSDEGGRQLNEDYASYVNKDGYLFFVVADGLGGMGKGDEASKTAVETILTCIDELQEEDYVTEEVLTEWFERANDEVVKMQTPSCRMGTTLCLLVYDTYENEVFYAHVGDSRIYHFCDGEVKYMSFDHSVSRMSVVAGEIKMEEIRFHPDRSKLLRAVGKTDEINPEIQMETIDTSKDHAFLLCTDGLWEYVKEEEMLILLNKSKDADQWLGAMRMLHDKRAKEGCDNHTAIVWKW